MPIIITVDNVQAQLRSWEGGIHDNTTQTLLSINISLDPYI